MNVDLLSISGIHTRMAVREADVVMDLGLAGEAAMRCNTALLTHLHADHASASWTWAAQGAFRYGGARTMVCHEAVLDQLRAFLEAGRAMNGGEDELPTLIGVAPGARVALPTGGRYALALGTNHRVPSCGWALVETRRKTPPRARGGAPGGLPPVQGRGPPRPPGDGGDPLRLHGRYDGRGVDRQPRVLPGRAPRSGMHLPRRLPRPRGSGPGPHPPGGAPGSRPSGGLPRGTEGHPDPLQPPIR
jgi:hypothetical protein